MDLNTSVYGGRLHLCCWEWLSGLSLWCSFVCLCLFLSCPSSNHDLALLQTCPRKWCHCWSPLIQCRKGRMGDGGIKLIFDLGWFTWSESSPRPWVPLYCCETLVFHAETTGFCLWCSSDLLAGKRRKHWKIEWDHLQLSIPGRGLWCWSFQASQPGHASVGSKCRAVSSPTLLSKQPTQVVPKLLFKT